MAIEAVALSVLYTVGAYAILIGAYLAVTGLALGASYACRLAAIPVSDVLSEARRRELRDKARDRIADHRIRKHLYA